MAAEDELLGAGAPEGDDASLRDTLSEAFDALDGSLNDGGAPAPTPAAAAPPADQAALDRAAADRTRDQQGRFAPKGDAAPIPPISEPGQPGASAAPPAGATSGPPPSWSAAAKAEFTKLPEVIRNEIAKREVDMDRGKAQWQQGAERLNRLDEVLAPRSERFRLAGLNEVQAVQTLFAAQDYLERQPVDALLYLGRQSGVDWRAVFARLNGGQQAGPPPLPPQLQPLANQVQALTNTVMQQQQTAERQQFQGHLDQVHTFAADPKNLYFENVRTRMGELLRSKQATSLEDAYEQACWSDPQVRPLMIQSTDQKRQADAQAAARAKVAGARHASGSITGSPTPGATPGRQAPNSTLRDDLAAAWDAFA